MFKPGQSGNPAGRPKGARSKLEESFLDAVYADWEENGVAALQTVRTEDPSTYLRVVASVLPKESKHEHTHKGAESLSEEHARLVAESYLESIRSRQGGSAEQPGCLHDDVSA